MTSPQGEKSYLRIDTRLPSSYKQSIREHFVHQIPILVQNHENCALNIEIWPGCFGLP